MKKLLTRAASYLPPDRVAFIQRAYEFAAIAHGGQMRLSGEPFIRHPLETALYLVDLNMDATTLAAALLHDVMEDCDVSREELEREFNKEVAALVDGVTKLNRLDVLNTDTGDGSGRLTDDFHDQAGSLRKMLVAMARDLRVVLIKLADRLHNMRTLKAHSPERRLIIAQETLDIYAPLAHRLGMEDIKWRLEDMAFHYLEPARYRQISRLLARRREEREQYIKRVCETLSQALKSQGLDAEVTGRAKHIYSIHNKMQTYADQGKDFDEIYDLFAIRVLASAKADCYAILGVAHSLWAPLPGQFDDYIAKPKDNMYESLHTAVMGPEAMPLEVQIKTRDMHTLAEYGIASHWRYKEGQVEDARFEQQMTWLRQLLEWQRDVTGAEEFLENVKTDLFPDQVFVHTPKGEVKELPAGSTPIDFAYRVHTELGHRCIGAKVNGKLVALDYQLNNADTVEILASKSDRGPTLDWLNPHAGYVKSATARQRIRTWFRRQERGANIQRGRELLARELSRSSSSPDDAELLRMFEMDALEDLLADLGSGLITVNQMAARLAPVQERPSAEEYIPPTGPASGLEVLGVGDLLTHLARCCAPLPGDAIVGFITRSRGITVHRQDCRNVANEDEPERLVRVDWGATKSLHPVRLSIEAWDRVGLLRDITTLVSSDKVNIASMVTRENDEGMAIIQLTLFTTGTDQLSRLFTRLEGVQGVITVTRANSVSTNGNVQKPERSPHGTVSV